MGQVLRGCHEEWQARVELRYQPRAATSARGTAWCNSDAGIISRNVLVYRSGSTIRRAGGRYKPWNPLCCCTLRLLCLAGSLSSAPAPPPASLRFFTLSPSLCNPFASYTPPPQHSLVFNSRTPLPESASCFKVRAVARPRSWSWSCPRCLLYRVFIITLLTLVFGVTSACAWLVLNSY